MLISTFVAVFLGICFGSFVNALVWRIHQQAKTPTAKKKRSQYSVINGRSMCPNCHHELVALDLVPVLSWLALGRRCRYCHKAISWQYPLVELCGGLVFGVSYLAWPHLQDAGQFLLLGTWLLASVGLLALAVYDIKWQLLPNRILYPTLLVALSGRLGYLLFYSPHKAEDLVHLGLSIAVASGLFWLIFHLSKGAWIGYGDVRLGLVTGTVLASPQLSLLMIFLASLLGTAMVAPSLARGGRSVSSKIPYGPYLIAGCAISLLWGDKLINAYTSNLLINPHF